MCAFEVGAYDQGAHVTYLGPTGSQIGHKESIKDTAPCSAGCTTGSSTAAPRTPMSRPWAQYAGVPVWNGLTDEWHPTQMLADILTMRDHCGSASRSRSRYGYLGDARNNTANSLLVTGALLGMDVRVAAPEALWPSPDVQAIAHGLASSRGHGSPSPRTQDRPSGDRFLTPTSGSRWESRPSRGTPRIDQLLPYQVNGPLMAATGNPGTKFMHCLPALHNTETAVGQQIFEKRGLADLEVTEEVFESEASIVFDQAENRLHTIKALMVATLAGEEDE